MSTHVLAIDPGLANPAAALFVDGALIAASRVKASTNTKQDIGMRGIIIANAIVHWYADVIPNPAIKLVFVQEWIRTYPGAKAKPSKNLFPLTGVAMATAGMLYDKAHEFDVKSYEPRIWSGGLPKSTTGDPLKAPRGFRVWGRLNAVEQGRVTKLDHDTIDAIGIGLFYLGRMERRCVFPGSTPG